MRIYSISKEITWELYLELCDKFPHIESLLNNIDSDDNTIILCNDTLPKVESIFNNLGIFLTEKTTSGF